MGKKMDFKKLINKHIESCQSKINKRNRERLCNEKPTIICSNCLGGILYHWLGLEFRSPFINLFFKNEDFILLLENLEEFLATEIVEDKESKRNFPVGIGYKGIKVYFMHYKTFEEAIIKWNARKERMSRDNLVVLFSNFEGDEKILERFQKLPFRNKLVFVEEKYKNYDCTLCLSGYEKYKERHRKNKGSIPNIWHTKSYVTGERFIDEFDYVEYLNSIL